MRSPRQGVLQAIEAWQRNPARPRGMCLHTPTCSVYGHAAITRYGLLRGGFMAAWRVFRCNSCLLPDRAHGPPPR
ncbi:MAG TPA: membrane protein insertion efficiency factor YidD [Trebonia sp.]